MKLAAVWHILKTAALDWQRHNASRLGAAIAYYAIFSIAPLLVDCHCHCRIGFRSACGQRRGLRAGESFPGERACLPRD